ncbi:hypothetical protein CDO73_06950 [Saccharibacillus sp. O23]|uniref:hypothetical protein n=1 Tax=Saccharibacillus sp. O23 TaxID=2009338 RepID=UPI000B4E7159|nr:hypothetical protein [Saccharibacillus sp. O23]OWR31459.1 hypothetical protein CDO73_06950 [Saccharibacillus sp. O23]
MRIKKKKALSILCSALLVFSLTPVSALASDGASGTRISPEEQRRLQETYGLEPPQEASPAAIGDFGFQIGGLSGSFGGSDLSNPRKSAVLLAKLGVWTVRPLPSAARICVLALNPPN